MGFRPGDTSSHPRAAGSSSSSVDTTRGDGDTTRGDGDAEDTGELTRRGHDGHFGLGTLGQLDAPTQCNC